MGDGAIDQKTPEELQKEREEHFKKIKKCLWLELIRLHEYPVLSDEYKLALNQVLSYYTGVHCDKYGINREKSLLAVGGVGTGKTSLLKIFAKSNPFKFKVASCQDIAFDFTEHGFSVIKGYTSQSFDNKREPISWLFDDLGLERQNMAFYANKDVNIMSEIIYGRYEYRHRMKTHFTTNLPMYGKKGEYLGLNDIYGQRAVSRLTEMCNVINFGNLDLRK